MIRHENPLGDPSADPDALVKASERNMRALGMIADQETSTARAVEVGIISDADITFADLVLNVGFSGERMGGVE